ncbi:hypothetical protein C882_2256 [Caenispirillum salinarum AK4]|uniref:Uncharacterized protein n=1 Tax=Caenispirillum salinarum AK4 TaxID=1238182 RepID=K9GPN9_9PROT|nr:hypothetical protein [Caenispirillum salinarum]EKV26629.1 hypothetical protein C882_2256 [Caenispirillum salinarum AK4]
MTTTMHAHLSDFLAGYVAGLGRDAAPAVARRLDDMARRLPEWEAEALECLYRDIALWFDAGLTQDRVAARLADVHAPALSPGE